METPIPALPTGLATISVPRADIAAAAFCMQLAFGAVYGWSVFLNPLREHFGASKTEANLTFTITSGGPGRDGGVRRQPAAPDRPARDRDHRGPALRDPACNLSGFAPNLGTLYLSYEVLGGVGLGFGYIVPLAVLIAWFPDKRGFITGLAVTGFGLGALSPVRSQPS